MLFTVEACEKRVEDLYKQAKDHDNMWAEARGQWLDSCLECAEQYEGQDLEELEERALFWLQNMYADCGYEWMERGLQQAEDHFWWL